MIQLQDELLELRSSTFKTRVTHAGTPRLAGVTG